MPALLLQPAPPANAIEASRPEPPPRRLSASSSLLLDTVRFTAALAVLLHHFTDSRMSTGWPHLGVLGHEAVCVFFVLSGFVIRLVTVTRAATLGQYAIDRASRIYSVVAPALLATVVCEALAATLRPEAYATMRDAFAWRDVTLQLLANLTFTAQNWGFGLNPLSNAPFWSLSYEVLYYALYGVVHYRVRGRWWIVAGALLISGPSIALLFPLWLLGVLTCDFYLALSCRRGGLRWVASTLVLLTSTLAALRHPIAHLLRAISHENRAVWLTAHVARRLPWRQTHPELFLDPTGHLPWLSETSLSFLFIGAFTACFMLAGLLFLDRHAPNLPPHLARTTRTVADSTFTLYLFHVPLMLLAVVCLGHPVHSTPGAVLLLGSIVLLTIPLARVLDRLKDHLRSALRRRV